MRHILRRVGPLALALTIGCGLWPGGRKPATYTTPEGYLGSEVRRGPIVLDAVFMDDSTRGIEGVVRLSWWGVFSVTVQNRSRSDLSVPVSSFTLVDGSNREHSALTLDQVLNSQTYVVGPLMSYQRRAVRRAFWSEEPIPPGAFAVGYLFFPRVNRLLPAKLILDPNPDRRKDELIAVFPSPVAPEPEAPPAPPEESEGASEPDSLLAEPPEGETAGTAATDTTTGQLDRAAAPLQESSPTGEAAADGVTTEGAGADESAPQPADATDHPAEQPEPPAEDQPDQQAEDAPPSENVDDVPGEPTEPNE